MPFRKKKSLLDQAHDYMDTVRPQVESAVSSAVDATVDFYESTARPALADARDKAVPVLTDARDKATPYVVEARDRAAAALAEARDNAAPVLADARDKAVQKTAPLVADARGRAGDVAASAKQAADARVAQLKGEKPKKGSRLKKLALFAVVAAAVGFVATKLRGGSQQDDWQSSYVPTPAPAPTAVPTPVTDDVAGSAPDEALADATDTTQPVSTPDEPAEVIDLEPTDGESTTS